MNTPTASTPIKSIGRPQRPRKAMDTPQPSPKTVYLVSMTPPRHGDGRASNEFTGVYLGDDGAAHVRLPDRVSRHILPSTINTWSRQQIFALLAVILQMELDDQPETFIQSAIYTLTNPDPQCEVA